MSSDLPILIATKNRDQELQLTLRKLSQTSRCIILDQSTIPSKPPNRKHLFTFLHRPEVNSLPQARNHLLQTTNKQWVVFIDDDCDIAGNFLTELQTLIANQPEVTAWGPVVEQRPQWLRRVHRLLQLGALRDPRRLTAGPADLPTRALFGCCFAVRRDLALATQFDGRRRGYALGEDLDFFLRLPGEKRFSKNLHCVHREAQSGRADAHTRGQAKAAFLCWMARRHGRHNPCTVLHLVLALVAAAGAGMRARERASLRGLWRGLHHDPFVSPASA